MAGVYIPGIEIPTEKPVAILLCTDRSVGLYDVVAGKLRHIRECEPAIPVSEHGDLIDGNALAELFRSKVEGDKGIGSLMVKLAALCIDNAPVVIPGDKEGDGNVPDCE